MASSSTGIILTKFLCYLQETGNRHKKKLITLAILAIGIYLCKKHLTLTHIISIVQKIVNIFSYLPLPQPQPYRQGGIYRNPEENPLISLTKIIRVEEISAKIKSKVEGGWNQLKHSVLTGVVLSMCLYNADNFYSTVKSKYLEDFKLLNSEDYFCDFVQRLKQKFYQSFQLSFQLLRDTLYNQIHQLELRSRLQLPQIQEMMSSLIKCTFMKRYDYDNQVHGDIWKRYNVSEKVKTIFKTPYLPLPPTNVSKKVMGSIMSFVGSVVCLPFKIMNLLPTPKLQVSSERFYCLKMFYLLPVKKMSIIRNNEDRLNEAQTLCKLVLNQVQQLVETLNFATFISEYAETNLKIFMNRVEIYLLKNNKRQISIADFLPISYKIVKQQILVNKKKREQFYEGQILKALRLVNSNDNNQIQRQINDNYERVLEQRNSILQQIFMTNRTNYLERQFHLKYFHERSQIVINPQKMRKSKVEDGQMQQMLNMLSRDPIAQQEN